MQKFSLDIALFKNISNRFELLFGLIVSHMNICIIYCHLIVYCLLKSTQDK